jgi:hypothetical protein
MLLGIVMPRRMKLNLTKPNMLGDLLGVIWGIDKYRRLKHNKHNKNITHVMGLYSESRERKKIPLHPLIRKKGGGGDGLRVYWVIKRFLKRKLQRKGYD